MSDDIIDVEPEGEDDEPGTDLVVHRPIYERMPGETTAQWEAFLVYRDLGVSRSLSAVASELGKLDRRRLEKWSSRLNWVNRIAAYEIEQEKLDREANRQARNRMLERQQALGAVGVATALKRLHGHGKPGDDDYVEALDPNELDAGETIRMAEVFSKIERAAWGEPSDLVGRALKIGPDEVLRVVSQIVDCAMRYVPKEMHDSFIREIQAIGASQ